MKNEQEIRVLLEMRPALDGFAGIPQETRLLFLGLAKLNWVRVDGLLQASLAFISTGSGAEPASEDARIDRVGQVVVSMADKPSANRWAAMDLFLKRRRIAFWLALKSVLFPRRVAVRTSWFASRGFESFVWQALFSKTLLVKDFKQVTQGVFRVCSIPWNTLQSAGLNVLKWRKRAMYPLIDTTGADVFLVQTPYPGRPSPGTALVVRYHDALPLLMPHAFANMARHRAAHMHALRCNVESGAYFACVSEATRQDLLKVFPEVADRAVTIHNMVSEHYFDEVSSPSVVPGIIRVRINTQLAGASPAFKGLGEQEDFYRQHLLGSDQQSFKYLLMVSTLEPRKNHLCLLAAWHALRLKNDTQLKLVLVGSAGWGNDAILREMRPFIDQGSVFVLSGVPAADLRALYKHAAVTVCPSLAEGFDFSGVESMCSGGVVVASDIAVHREVYADAALYFVPYSTEGLQSALQALLYSPQSGTYRSDLCKRSAVVTQRYTAEALLSQWQSLLRRVTRELSPAEIEKSQKFDMRHIT